MRPFTIILFMLSWTTVFGQANTEPGASYGANTNIGRRIAAKNASIYYEIYGAGEPLLLLHDTAQSINVFKSQISVLSEKYKVIAVDMRGHGNSTGLKTKPIAYDLLIGDIKTLLDSLGIPETNILGWGTGGTIGLIMAYRYPGYVHKLAITGTGLDPLYLNLINLHKVTAPVLVMAGERDYVPEEQARSLAKEIVNAKLLIYKGAGHSAPIEVPDNFNSAIIRFLTMNNADIRKMIDFAPEKFN